RELAEELEASPRADRFVDHLLRMELERELDPVLAVDAEDVRPRLFERLVVDVPAALAWPVEPARVIGTADEPGHDVDAHRRRRPRGVLLPLDAVPSLLFGRAAIEPVGYLVVRPEDELPVAVVAERAHVEPVTPEQLRELAAALCVEEVVQLDEP